MDPEDRDRALATLRRLAPEARWGEVTIGDDEVVAVLPAVAIAALAEGHFPGEPMLPGAYLLALCGDLACVLASSQGGGVRAVAMRRAVFREPLRPGEDAVLIVRRGRAGTAWLLAEARAASSEKWAARAEIRIGADPCDEHAA